MDVKKGWREEGTYGTPQESECLCQHGSYCPKTLLMGMYFLKGYASQAVNYMVWGVSKPTYHFYVWKAVHDLANLSVLDFHSCISELNR